MNTTVEHPTSHINQATFEALFGHEENSHLLIDLINNMIEPKQPVISLTHLPPYDDSSHCDGKVLSTNVRAKDQNGNVFHITLQLDDMPCLSQQISFNMARECDELYHHCDDINNIGIMTSIWLLTKAYHDDDEFHHHHRIEDPTHGVVLTEKVAIHTFELNKWQQPQPMEKKHLWPYFFTQAKNGLVLSDEANSAEMKLAMEVLEQSK